MRKRIEASPLGEAGWRVRVLAPLAARPDAAPRDASDRLIAGAKRGTPGAGSQKGVT
ncbi:hypothetical protein [Novosphingobium panipatense]|uniref:hypothetical protein n=1 Tax=Novosphingobium panipatense TaxID=428991 RepID=UPI0024B6CF15|nr:hypothetical protein [Novosphingobium panipatense]